MIRSFRVLFFVVLLVMVAPEITERKKFALEGISDDVVEDFNKEYTMYLDTLVLTQKLQQMFDVLNYKAGDDSSNRCLRCLAGVRFLLEKLKKVSREEARSVLQDLCVKFKIQEHKHVCTGLIEMHLDIILYILKNSQQTHNDVCGLVYQRGECNLTKPFIWEIEVNKNKPKVVSVEGGPASVLNVVQISDVHYDPKYLVRSNAVCGEPACCRSAQGYPNRTEDGAGKWGDYRGCDTSLEAIQDAFDQIKKQHKEIDLIYFTGDIIDHGIWETSFEENIRNIKLILSNMKQISPNTTICPVLGNHEAHPYNLFAPGKVADGLNSSWLYEEMVEEWQKLIGIKEISNHTIEAGGYYTVVVKPGLRVIALNSNVAYVFNWWLLYDPHLPKEQLEWLHGVLLEAEKNNERVHIIGHIPPGKSSNLITWDREYRRIVERFSNIITGQFHGHTHNDEFTIFYNSSNASIPISAAFNGGSVTAFPDRNPNYKLYHVNSSNYDVIDFESWIYNLTAANLAPSGTRPNWFKMYSFKEQFGLHSLSPAELDELVQRMSKDENLARKYYRYKVKQADSALARGCDEKCLKRALCEIVTTVPNDNEKCKTMIYSSAVRFIPSWLLALGYLCVGIVYFH